MVFQLKACSAHDSLLNLQEISFKIQFLRLLQSFSDHHEYVNSDVVIYSSNSYLLASSASV